MQVFDDYLTAMADPQHRTRLTEILRWLSEEFPDLTPKLSRSQPVFLDGETFIIGFEHKAQALVVNPERAGVQYFSEKIISAGFDHDESVFRMPWNGVVDYQLLEEIVKFNILDKACSLAVK